MKMNSVRSVPILSLWMVLVLHVGAIDGWAGTAWREPMPVEAVNTPYHEKAPFLSFDGLTLYFGRQDMGGGQFTRIYQATRLSASDPFVAFADIVPLEYYDAQVSSPWVSADNLRMYYYAATSTKRLIVTTRSSPSEPWQPGLDISELNLLGNVVTPTLTQDERTIVFSGYNIPGGRGDYDLWMAERSNTTSRFERPWNLGALNTRAADVHPSLTPDGLTLYFMSRRNGRSQIFVAHRPSREAAFSDAEHLDVFDTPNGASEFPSVAADGKALYFGRWPNGGTMDIYVSYVVCEYYVDAIHGSDAHNGRSPETAFATIQRAINVAQDGDAIFVCPGVYREGIRFLGKVITVQSLGDAAVIEARNGFAVSFYGEGPGTVLRNVVIANSHVGLFYSYGAPTVTNVTVVGNVYGAQAFGTAPGPRISNSIFWGNVLDDLPGCQATYSCVQRSNPGVGNFNEDPLFVDAANGDYHLRSAQGRYWPEGDGWVRDDVTSPCIDAGDPAAGFSEEPEPNGGRLNIGAHGGTAYAELSETALADELN